MKLLRIVGMAALALAVAAPCLLAGEPAVDDLIKEFRGETEAKTRSPKQLEAAYAKVLDALVPAIKGENPQPRQQPEQALEAICWRAGRPGAEADRAAVCQAMIKRLGTDVSKEARIWLTKQLFHIGRDDAVAALAAQLAHKEPRVREWSRRALQNNTSPKSAAPLRAALAKAKEPAWKVALINALADKPGKTTVQAIVPQARGADDTVRAAACAALAHLGDKAAVPAIDAARSRGSKQAKAAATDAYLLLADRLCEQDDQASALPIYRKLLSATGHVRCAAIIGMGRAGGADSIGIIFEALASQDARERGAGLAALELLPPDVVLAAIQGKLKTAPPEMKVALLRALMRRADKAILSAFLAAAADGNEAVRIAAYEGMGKLQDERAAPILVAALLKRQGAELGVVQRAVNRIPGKAMTEALIAAMPKASAKARVEIIRSLALREPKDVTAALLGVAGEDADASVRSEALKALAGTADASALPRLVKILVAAKESRDRRAAENTVAAVARKIDDESQRVKPVLAAMKGAGVEARGALLRVAGRLGGAEALAAIQAARKDANAEIQDAAIRTLVKWDDPAVADDLLDIAKTGKSLPHRVLALEGYVRVVGLMGNLPVAELLKKYEAAMAAAPRPEDRRLVLAGMGQVGNLGALRMAQQYLGDAKLKAEAEIAVVQIASAIGSGHKAEAKAALEAIVKSTANKGLKKRASDALDVLGKFEDYIVAWQVAGPYTKGNANSQALFGIVFDPEKPDAKGVKWQLMPPGTTKSAPYRIEPDKVGSLRGGNRCCYFRTRIYSPEKQQVRMDMGSDDGIKVWLGGKPAYANNANRPCSPGQDKAKITLEKGWQPLMVKLTQGGGEWAFCLRFRAADGSRLDGIRTQMGGGE